MFVTVVNSDVVELAAELFSEAQRGRSLDRLHCDDAANISRKACVSPCSLVIALLYLERLKKICPEYLERTASSDLFLVSLVSLNNNLTIYKTGVLIDGFVQISL